MDESEQGTIQGALYGVRALGQVRPFLAISLCFVALLVAHYGCLQGFGPLFFNLMFTLWTSNNYGFPYVRGESCFRSSLVLACYWSWTMLTVSTACASLQA